MSLFDAWMGVTHGLVEFMGGFSNSKLFFHGVTRLENSKCVTSIPGQQIGGSVTLSNIESLLVNLAFPSQKHMEHSQHLTAEFP